MKYGLNYFTDTYLTSIGLMIFFVFFVGVVRWVSRKASRQLYNYIETLPLEKGESDEK